MNAFVSDFCSLQAFLLLAAMLFCIGVWGLDQQPQRRAGADEH